MKRLVLTWVLATVTTVTTVHADPRTASALYAEGQTAYQARDYDVAATKFIAAYAADADPVYLFNAAQAYRFGKDCDQSADYYQRFLAKVPNPPNADKIKAWAADMRACASLRATPPPPPPITTIVPPPAPLPPPVSVDAPSRGPRIAAYVTGGIGIVALGLATVSAVQGRAARRDQDAVCPTMDCTWMAGPPGTTADYQGRLDAARRRGDAANLRAYVGFAVGGVALAASVGLFVYTRGAHGTTERQLAIVPTTTGGLVVGTFGF
ncbi:MAG: hypothetical protein NT062_31650 [Proteobacteria bacterium]|nr:hypothetical protein [Pseudomonadota bacterium]